MYSCRNWLFHTHKSPEHIYFMDSLWNRQTQKKTYHNFWLQLYCSSVIGYFISESHCQQHNFRCAVAVTLTDGGHSPEKNNKVYIQYAQNHYDIEWLLRTHTHTHTFLRMNSFGWFECHKFWRMNDMAIVWLLCVARRPMRGLQPVNQDIQIEILQWAPRLWLCCAWQNHNARWNTMLCVTAHTETRSTVANVRAWVCRADCDCHNRSARVHSTLAESAHVYLSASAAFANFAKVCSTQMCKDAIVDGVVCCVFAELRALTFCYVFWSFFYFEFQIQANKVELFLCMMSQF